jgi:5'-nucleotidase
MVKDRPLLFLSNDDGISAKGLRSLIDMLRGVGDLVVVAPDGGRSGASSSISTGKAVTLKKVVDELGITEFACSGTPVDCVKLGLDYAVSRRPDLLIGGINHGDNASVSAHYSGTMGIVLEGTMKGITSIGYSLCSFDADADFEPLRPYVERITRQVLQEGLPENSCLNVNFPVRPTFNGVKICRMANGKWDNEWERHEDSDGYWLTGDFTNVEPDRTDTDSWALSHGYVAVTPTQVDVTDYELMDKLNQWNLK